ncbi:MAG: glycoside hydrolase family 78 protein [Lachnospiraceae bacterium]|nr:glycoside hydrolase family 78 protein [Butyrivibrio sp.]MCM1343900.1 glycoside hydrolase family 78 protein [Muribaculaceae bacterium]MCM1408940.1 glycoside hydrolase family 78 protein [Lachnospiraceae bacterium]
MKVTRLRTNRMENPLGFWMEEIRLSCVVEEAVGKEADAVRYQVSETDTFCAPVYDSGEQPGQENLVCFLLPYEVKPRTRYHWRAWVRTDAGEEAWSEPAWFETPRNLNEPWEADFIVPAWEEEIHPVMFRKLEIQRPVRRARAYMLGLGVYELWVNGEKAGDEFLLPGLHAYDSWLQYQTFELKLTTGENLLEVFLGNGWYKGPYGLKRSLPRFGTEFGVIGEIDIYYADGSRERILTDEKWCARKSSIVVDSIYDGEQVDESGAGTLPESGAPEDMDGCAAVKATDFPKERLMPRLSPYLQIQERLKPTLLITPAGETVLDLGQNMVGWVSFRNTLPEGTKVRLQYGEILQQGNFYRDNLRCAKAEFVYVSDGKEKEVRPHFTFYGFRYVKVEGWPGEPDPDDFTGCVIHSRMERTGELKTSNEKLNRLFENIIWGQKGNFLDVPTDCPQRDERMGWTGDAQVFADTACFNMDVYAFYEKFGMDLYCEQKKCGGGVPYVVPMSRYELYGASTWGDAAAVIPWQTYLHFADPHILKRQYDSMRDWVEYMRRADEEAGGRRLWVTGKHFGDWLALDGKIPGGVYGRTDAFYIASAFYYYSTTLTAKAAEVLEKEEDAGTYRKLAEEILAAFQEEYFTPAGRLAVDTQTAYALAACMGLVPERFWERFKKDFRKKMLENNLRLETGFAGTPYLLPALSVCGHDDIAYELLLREEYPGWLYEVNLGATTVWERWNSMLADGSMNPEGMNSLNHYAYGSVAAWMYRYMAGVSPTEEAPGFGVIELCPRMWPHMDSLELTLQTVYGKVRVAWNVIGERKEGWNLQVTVPFGARARLELPEGCKSDALTRKTELSPGTYAYQGVFTGRRTRWSLESDWRKAMEDPKARGVLEEYFPRAVKGIAFQREMYTLGEVAHSPFSEMSEEQIRLLEQKLKEVR